MLKKVSNHLILTLIAFSICSKAAAWGAKGHQIIAYVGGNLTTDGQAFWRANLQPLRQLSTVPDRIWKGSATKIQENPTHWFQADAYYTPEHYNEIVKFPAAYADAVKMYSEKTILINGTAPWRIHQLYRLALNSFKMGDMKAALEYAGAMTHYVGDISQPLHASENYDGQHTGNTGIHSYFETSIISDENKIRADVQTRAERLLKNPVFLKQFSGVLMDDLLLEVSRSIQQLDEILNNDNRYGRNAAGAAKQLELAKDRMADGAATVTLILNQLWKESGLIAQATPLTIHDPEWIKPDYKQLRSQKIHLENEDDCSAE